METPTYTVKETATLLGCTEAHVRWLARNKRVESVRKTPRKTLITVRSVEAMVNENNNSNK